MCVYKNVENDHYRTSLSTTTFIVYFMIPILSYYVLFWNALRHTSCVMLMSTIRKSFSIISPFSLVRMNNEGKPQSKHWAISCTLILIPYFCYHLLIPSACRICFLLPRLHFLEWYNIQPSISTRILSCQDVMYRNANSSSNTGGYMCGMPCSNRNIFCWPMKFQEKSVQNRQKV